MKRAAPRIVKGSAARGGAGAQSYPEGHTGFRIEIGDASDEACGGSHARVVENPIIATPLSEAEAEALFEGVDAIEEQRADVQEFAIREKSLKPPRGGAIEVHRFGEGGPSGVTDGEDGSDLSVLRYMPEGKVNTAPHLSITFSHPMVALGTVAQVASSEMPVELSPEPPGRWRWVGTKTLLYEPAHRFPASSHFKVVVPRGTTSVSGKKLKASVSWEFETPLLAFESMFPAGQVNGQTDVSPLIFTRFNQRIDPEALASRAVIEVNDSTEIPVRLATEEELGSGSDNASAAVKTMLEKSNGCGMVIKPQRDLPTGARCCVVIRAPANSAEGPDPILANLKSAQFSTYGEFTMVPRHDQSEISSFAAMSLRFTNPIDPASVSSDVVTVTPAVGEMRIHSNGVSLMIAGQKSPSTTYSVVVHTALRDVYGQALAREGVAEFKTSKPRYNAQLHAFRQGMYIADPFGDCKALEFPVVVAKYRTLIAAIYKVSVEDWTSSPWGRYQGSRGARILPDDVVKCGSKVWQREIATECGEGEVKTISIPLTDALNDDGLGHVIVDVTVPVKELEGSAQRHPPHLTAWVQSTRLGLAALPGTANSGLFTNVLDLTDGTPVNGAKVELLVAREKGRSVQAAKDTAADGSAHLPLRQQTAREGVIVTASKGGDSTFLTQEMMARNMGQAQLLWHVFTDRNMYKPNEEVSFKGYVRELKPAVYNAVSAVRGVKVTYVVKDPRGQKIATGSATTSAFGSFDFRVTLPDNLNLGNCSCQVTAKGKTHYHSFQVQEFRMPEYSVSANTVTSRVVSDGGVALVDVSASYYAGGALENASVDWTVSTQASHFTPPNWSEFTFGASRPSWTRWCCPGGGGGGNGANHFPISLRHESKLDTRGKDLLQIKASGADTPPTPVTVTVQAGVMDINRQRQAASTSFLVHPSEVYVGVKRGRGLCEASQPIPTSVVVANIDGDAVPDVRVRLDLVRVDSEWNGGQWKRTEHSVCEVHCTSSSGAVDISSIIAPKGGYHELRAVAEDAQGRTTSSTISMWVAGPEARMPQNNTGRGVQVQEVMLLPDQNVYEAGEEARVLVQPPFTPCECVAVVTANDITDVSRFTISNDAGCHTLSVPLPPEAVPGLRLHVDCYGSTLRGDESDRRRPALARGQVSLEMSKLSRTLSTTVRPHATIVVPGGETDIDIEVLDPSGAAAADAEVTVVMVDEAVLSLTNYELKSAAESFVRGHHGHFATVANHSNVYFMDWNDIRIQEPVQPMMRAMGRFGGGRGGGGGGAPMMMMACSAAVDMVDDGGMSEEKGLRREAKKSARSRHAAIPSNGDGGGAGQEVAVETRSNFNPLALFEPSATTDSTGRVTVHVKMPDSLTRYRVWAVAVSRGERYGLGESTLQCCLPVMVRPSLPRFLNFGDRANCTVVVQNLALPSPEEAGSLVRVAIRAANAELDSSARAFKAHIPQGRRCEVQFPASSLSVGKARFQIVVRGEGFADCAEVEVPVWTPAVTEAFATYGEIDGKGHVVEQVVRPSNVIPQFGSLDVMIGSTALHALTDAFLYLWNYQHECAEQRASRCLAVIALKDVLHAFGAPGVPSKEHLVGAVNSTIARLKSSQKSDGGFGWWSSSEVSSPYITVHVAHMLVRAQEKSADGYQVPGDMLRRVTSYLASVRDRLSKFGSKKCRLALRSYALFVCWMAGSDFSEEQVMSIWNDSQQGKQLSLEAMGHLLMTLPAGHGIAKAILKYISNNVTETAETAHFVTSYGDAHNGSYLLLHSSRRSDAVVLEALLRKDHTNSLCVKLVKGLLAHRKRGRWNNTNENCFVLLALDQYFQRVEGREPNYTARVWVGEDFAGENAFKGYSTETHKFSVPMDRLLECATDGDATPLIIERDGEEGHGRLYYRAALSYAPEDLRVPPADAGFFVERTYSGVDNAHDVTRDKDGVWHVRSGCRVRVKLTLSNPARRYHVALVDKLPAGFEPMNPALKTTGSLPEEPADAALSQHPWSWRRVWFEHQNMRDERVEAFASLLSAGVHTYSYIANATSIGKFVAPSAHAEEMYSPEVFGRTATESVVIE